MKLHKRLSWLRFYGSRGVHSLHWNCRSRRMYEKLAATLRGSRPEVQSASLIMTSLMTS